MSASAPRPHTRPGHPPDPWLPVPMRVIEVTRETADTVTLTLDASAHPVHFAPGQFTMLYSFGVGEVPISISGDPAQPSRLVHTIRAVGRVTHPLVATPVGGTIGVRGPYGTAWPVDPAQGRDVVIVAGGIGLAPVRPVLYRILADRAAWGRVLLLAGARTPADLLYRAELEALAAAHEIEVHLTVDRPGPGWQGPVGVVTRLLEVARFDPARATVITCGPEVMMKFVVREALHLGVPASDIWLSMERNMKCAIGLCGHCQWGRDLLCRGPVKRWSDCADRFFVRGL